MFIRKKKIKGKEYAYLVSNSWTKKGSRQEVSKYLGKVISLPKVKEIQLSNIPSERTLALQAIIQWKLEEYGFVFNEEKGSYQDVSFIPKTSLLLQHQRPIVLSMNEGYLCQFTLQQLLDYKEKGYPGDVGITLATYLIQCGLQVPQEVFIQLFTQHYSI